MQKKSNKNIAKRMLLYYIIIRLNILRSKLMTIWEYYVIKSVPTEETLKELGLQGWELVFMFPTGICYFKRPKLNNIAENNNNTSDKDAIRKTIEMYQ